MFLEEVKFVEGVFVGWFEMERGVKEEGRGWSKGKVGRLLY